MKTKSMAWVYIDRGASEEGLIREYEKELWEKLTRGGIDSFLARLVAVLPDAVKVVVVSAGSRVILFSPHDPVEMISMVKRVLREARSPYDVSLTIQEQAEAKPELMQVGQEPRRLEGWERDALMLLFGVLPLVQIEHKLNANFLPDNMKILFIPRKKYPVIVNTNDPAQMVSDIKAVFAQVGSNYDVKLMLREKPKEFVFPPPSEKIEAA